MSTTKNPYQVICIGKECSLYDKCGIECIHKNSFKSKIKGCHYSKKGDCKKCSHKDKCELIKPFFDRLRKIELKRINAEFEKKQFEERLHLWEDVEKNLREYEVDSVTEIIYSDLDYQQLSKAINSRIELIKACERDEKKLIEMMS